MGMTALMMSKKVLVHKHMQCHVAVTCTDMRYGACIYIVLRVLHIIYIYVFIRAVHDAWQAHILLSTMFHVCHTPVHLQNINASHHVVFFYILMKCIYFCVSVCNDCNDTELACHGAGQQVCQLYTFMTDGV